ADTGGARPDAAVGPGRERDRGPARVLAAARVAQRGVRMSGGVSFGGPGAEPAGRHLHRGPRLSAGRPGRGGVLPAQVNCRVGRGVPRDPPYTIAIWKDAAMLGSTL